MRFTAIYQQGCQVQGHPFDSAVGALDFLFWGYEDAQLVPYGIHDRLTDQITLYTHAGKAIAPIEPALIRSAVALLAGTGTD